MELHDHSKDDPELIDLFVDTDLAEKLGMRVEGELRENRWFRGRWWSTAILSILESEWR